MNYIWTTWICLKSIIGSCRNCLVMQEFNNVRILICYIYIPLLSHYVLYCYLWSAYLTVFWDICSTLKEYWFLKNDFQSEAMFILQARYVASKAQHVYIKPSALYPAMSLFEIKWSGEKKYNIWSLSPKQVSPVVTKPEKSDYFLVPWRMIWTGSDFYTA